MIINLYKITLILLVILLFLIHIMGKYLSGLAKVNSLISIIILLLFFTNGNVRFYALQDDTFLLMIFFPIGLIIGLIISWMKPIMGAIVGLTSVLLFYIVHYFKVQYFPEGFSFLIFSVPCFLFLIDGLIKKK